VDSVKALRELINNFNAAIRDIRVTDNLASSHQEIQLFEKQFQPEFGMRSSAD
jgi:hypothetical protein